MKRYQPTGITVCAILVIAAFFLFLFLVNMNFIDESKFLGYCIIFGSATALFFLLGIGFLISMIRSNLARDNGRNATCILLDKRVVTNRFGRYPRYYIIVAYVGENGKDYRHHVRVSEDFFCRAERGNMLRCLVYKTMCYIDPITPVFASRVNKNY